MAHYVLHQFSNNAKPQEKDKKACFSYESTCRRQGYVKILFFKIYIPIRKGQIRNNIFENRI